MPAVIFILIMSLVTFIMFGVDKHRAIINRSLSERKKVRRIPEATLLCLSALGGALGAWLGMKTWHHKTLHKKFKYGVPFLLILQVLLFCGLFGGAAYLLDYSLNPAGKEKRDAESMEYLRQYYPGTAEWVDSMQKASVLRDTVIYNSEGLRLHALYAAHPDARGTAVLVHGYTDNAVRMLMLGKFYYDTMQFNIMLPDHVRHGQSEGERIQMGWKDRLNIEQWIGVADSIWHEAPTYLHGISMGAATVMMCSGDPLPASVKGIIEDCGYTSVWDEFAGEIKNQFGLPVHPLMDIASHMCEKRYGWNFHEASALNQVKKSTLPMLFIHGDADTFVPTSMVYPLYEAKAMGYKKLWIAKGSEHARAFSDHPEEYTREVTDFIRKTK